VNNGVSIDRGYNSN